MHYLISDHMYWVTDPGIIGPAIGGIIAATAGLLFTLWKERRDKRNRQKIVARALNNELIRYKNFIDYFSDQTNITKDNYSGHELEKTLFMVTLLDNPFIKLDFNNNSSLISNKSPFEIFFQDIYRFDNEDLIRELVDFYQAITAADQNLKALSLIHISEPTRLLSISYAVFCLKKKTKN